MVNIWSSCSSETNPGKTWHRAWVISDHSVWLQGSFIRNGQEVLKEHEQIEKAQVCQSYTTTALKNRSYGVMNTNLRFFINMHGGGWERDTTVNVHSHVWVMGLQRIPISVYRTPHSPQILSSKMYKKVLILYVICYQITHSLYPIIRSTHFYPINLGCTLYNVGHCLALFISQHIVPRSPGDLLFLPNLLKLALKNITPLPSKHRLQP